MTTDRAAAIAIALVLAACGQAKDAPPAPPPSPAIDATPAAPAAPAAAGAPHGPTLAPRDWTPPPLPPLTALAPRPIAGPYADLAAYCAQQPSENRRGDPMPCDHGTPHVDGPIAIDAPTAPYTDVHLFPVDDGVSCSLAIATRDGVFVADRAIGCDWPGKTGLTIDRLELAGRMIVVHWRRRSRFSIGGVTTDETEDLVIACGVGPSRTPSCTPEIPVRLARTANGKTRTGEVSLVVGTDGTFVLDGDASSLVLDKGDAYLLRELGGDLGRHRLVFP